MQVFDEWNKGELDSFLIEITRDILKYKEQESDEQFLVEKIKDTAGQVTKLTAIYYLPFRTVYVQW